ncbi:hypothetical protein HDU91_006165 [Kappamyces sp. JEL0680]|nr:hypothetical protein HDU91_006165 [Kappamyces sp. JEL0680]
MARYLFHNCILGMFKGRTVIFSTHALSLVLPSAKYVVLVKSGNVVAQGTPSQIIHDEKATEVVSKELFDHSDLHLDGPAMHRDGFTRTPASPAQGSEGKAAKVVRWETYRTYITACGGLLFLLVVFCSFGIQISADYLQNWWIEVWTDFAGTNLDPRPHPGRAAFDLVHANYTAPFVDWFASTAHHDSLYYVTIFGVVSFIELFALLFKYMVQFIGGIRASRVLHERLLVAVLCSPMRFFETTPVGRILNRFNKDLSDVDLTVMWTLISFGTVATGASIRMILVSIITPPFSISILLLYFYWRTARFYLASWREIKRQESTSSSPIYALFGEMLAGVSTIRAYGAESQYVQYLVEKVDANHRAFFYLFASSRWLNVRSALLSCSMLFIAGVSILQSNLSAGWAGLVFNFAAQITQMINRSIQVHSSLEMAMHSVERIEEYINLPPEPRVAADTIPDQTATVLPAQWPLQGTIEVKNLTVRYAPELPDALKELSFSIKSREKVGIVGSHFTMVPQDPVLFEGTLRSNLDPLGQRDDAEIWESLQKTLFESLKHDPLGREPLFTLESPVLENGSNFSLGQRQLICLARALLGLTSFVFLDEAISSVDKDIWSKIQETLRKEFANCTVLRVAHRYSAEPHDRLKSVIDYDKILVLENGELVQLGTPFELLQNKDGVFHALCKESGEFDELVKLATKSQFKELRK